MRQGIALPLVAALAVLPAATSLHAQCTPTVRTVSQPSVFPNLVAGPIASDGARLALAKSDGTSTTPAIYFQLFDSNLNSISGDRQITTSSSNGAVALFFSDTANEFALFYQQTDATLMLQRLDANGAPIGKTVVMPHSWSFNDEFDIAWDHATGQYAIAHLVTGGRDLGLWLTMVSPAGMQVSDLQISAFVSKPTNPRVTTLPDGSVAMVWTSSTQTTFVTIVKSGSMLPIEITEQQVLSPRIAANNNSILAIYSSPRTSGGTQLRYTLLSASGGVTVPDSTYLNGRGVDIAPLSLQWNPTLSEWALVYSDSIAGFNTFPGEVHLRRFAAVGAPPSDTFLSPNASLNLLNAAFPIVFLNGGYVGSIARIVSTTQGGESYLVRVCPLVTSFTVDHPIARSFSPINFGANASGGSPNYSFLWTFGDNASATGPFVQHMYTANGTYIVTLTTTDSAGATAIFKSTVVITDQMRGRAVKH